MTAFYIANDQGVDMTATQRLLIDFSAIWCPPPGLREWNGNPAPNDQLTLGYLQRGSLYLLGIGMLTENSTERYRTSLLFTNTDVPGIRDGAENLGYEGGSAVSFLILRDVHTFTQPFPCLPASRQIAPGVQVFTP